MWSAFLSLTIQPFMLYDKRIYVSIPTSSFVPLMQLLPFYEYGSLKVGHQKCSLELNKGSCWHNGELGNITRNAAYVVFIVLYYAQAHIY